MIIDRDCRTTFMVPKCRGMIVAKVYQAEFPRSKRRRIRQKWAKQARRYRETPYPGITRRDGVLVLHPKYMAWVSASFKREIERKIFKDYRPQSVGCEPVIW